MKKLLIFFCIQILFLKTYAQLDISGGMEIGLNNYHSLANYVTENHLINGEEMKQFGTGVGFFAEAAVNIFPMHQLAFDFNYTIFTFDKQANFLGFKINVYSIRPSLIYYKFLYRSNYFLIKIGAGVGLRKIQLEQKSIFTDNYWGNGYGFFFRGIINTAVDNNFFVYLALETGFDKVSSISNSGNRLINPRNNENVNCNLFYVKFKLGLTLSFGNKI